MKIIAYKVSNHLLPIRPANPKRQWMDKSIAKNPYRCLPLSMANSYGWEILSDGHFTVEWESGQAPADVKVHRHSSDGIVPIPLFGEGTFTFHTGHMFKTEYPYGLYVTGAPNFIKPNVIPLSGIVETHWLPFTFTMNWRFTQPGKVTFEKGDVLCQVFPIDMNLFDNIETPEIVELSTDPEFSDLYWEWNVARSSYIDGKRRGIHGLNWQKNYFVGNYPHDTSMKCPMHMNHDTNEMESGHRTKPNVPEFIDKTTDVPYAMPEKFQIKQNKIIEENKREQELRAAKKKEEQDTMTKEKTMTITNTSMMNTLPDVAEKINNSDKLILLYVAPDGCDMNLENSVQTTLQDKIKTTYHDKVEFVMMCIPEENMPFPRISTNVLYFFAPKNQTPLFFREKHLINQDLDHDIIAANKMIQQNISYMDAKFDQKTIDAIKATEEYVKNEDVSQFPSTFKMARNLAKEVWQTGKNAAKGLPILVSAEVGFERYSTCESCDKFEKDSARCRECGCFMKTKTQLASASCPIGKWSAVS